MSIWYRVLYQLGITPWEVDATEGLAATQIAELFKREEVGREPPFGRALDLGCGSGVWSVELASRGWQVTGVDIVEKALRLARERSRTAGTDVRFVQGDVTALPEIGVEPGVRLVLDLECFNHLTDRQRSAVGRGVSAVAAADATILLLVWSRGRRWPLPLGASRNDIEAAFPNWSVLSEDAYADQGSLPSWLRSIELTFYRLGRA